MADFRLYFATDIHGSDRCFRKFLNAASFYRADVLVMGGDITGKMIVPILPAAGGTFTATVFNATHQTDSDGLPALRKFIADAGYYPYQTEPDEITALKDDPKALDDLFATVIRSTLDGWLSLAAERLAGTGVQCYLSPGNDDPGFVGPLLRNGDLVTNPERQVVHLPGGFEMISIGFSNITPWHSPREASEPQLAAMITKDAEKLANPAKTIFNLHVPPLRTPLDQAMLLDEEMRPVMRGGSPVIDGVGSSAVRSAIETYQPLLSLHGHIHESRGTTKLGRTVAVNPGSEYSEGILRGALITVSERKGLKGFQLVSG
jgi:Icc-related predicted phosphoesterase